LAAVIAAAPMCVIATNDRAFRSYQAFFHQRLAFQVTYYLVGTSGGLLCGPRTWWLGSVSILTTRVSSFLHTHWRPRTTPDMEVGQSRRDRGDLGDLGDLGECSLSFASSLYSVVIADNETIALAEGSTRLQLYL
jgi:hypothetical protein